jgi:hypothetical protein
VHFADHVRQRGGEENDILLQQIQRLPGEDKRTKERADEDTDDDVPVEVHGQQHDKVRHGELEHVQQGAHQLLDQRGADGHLVVECGTGRLGCAFGGCADGVGGVLGVCVGAGFGCWGQALGRGCCGGVLVSQAGAADDKGVVFAADAAEELKADDEADDADAGAGEHAAGGVVPLTGEEAW